MEKKDIVIVRSPDGGKGNGTGDGDVPPGGEDVPAGGEAAAIWAVVVVLAVAPRLSVTLSVTV